MEAEQSRTRLPGFGLPVNEIAFWRKDLEPWERLPHAIADYYASDGVTLRERRMLDFMNQITDKPSWHLKVFDQEIVAKWKEEAVRWDESLPEKGDEWLSETMFEVCMKELQEKADRFNEVGFVSVLDCEATVVKSDRAANQDLRERLKNAVNPLEDVPERARDWHPKSDGKVLDLVHPSLFPVMYGYSKALAHGTVPLKTCASYTGKGDTIPEFKGAAQSLGHGGGQIAKAWGSFQWLPSNIKFSEDGKPKIDSYINNLHPQKHAELYLVLEQFVHMAIPLWNESISWFHNRIRLRIPATGRGDYYYPDGVRFPREQYRPNPEAESYESSELDSDSDSDSEDADEIWAEDNGLSSEWEAWHEQNKILLQHEPVFTPRSELEKRPGAKPIDLQKDFHEKGIQVIFKLANIELTPEKPTYDGGSWHVEGSLNEHICATALYYYDSENVTESRLAFRQSFNTWEMTIKAEQNQYESAEAYYGIQQNGPTMLNLGSVLTCPGRLLTFPNVLQHQVQPFSLEDRTRPGHRKILAMFLVDPHVSVLSTANVPPQRKDWWAEEVRKIEPFRRLSMEIFDMIIDAVEGFPFSWEDALEARILLMGERGRVEGDVNEAFEEETFFFCEH